MLHSEAGPADIFTKLRSKLGVKYDQYSNPYGDNWVAHGVLCYFCLSVWVGFAVMVVLLIGYLLKQVDLTIFILLPFAFSGIAAYLKKHAG